MNRKPEKHGMYRHPAYSVWLTMKARCKNPKARDYYLYGERGIKVCPKWMAAFTAFWADMGPTYAAGLELGRKDKDGDYTPENCHWATANVNQCARRNVHIIPTPWGPLPISEAARKAGLLPTQLHRRLSKKWTIERALSTPIQKQKGKNQ